MIRIRTINNTYILYIIIIMCQNNLSFPISQIDYDNLIYYQEASQQPNVTNQGFHDGYLSRSFHLILILVLLTVSTYSDETS